MRGGAFESTLDVVTAAVVVSGSGVTFRIPGTFSLEVGLTAGEMAGPCCACVGSYVDTRDDTPASTPGVLGVVTVVGAVVALAVAPVVAADRGVTFLASGDLALELGLTVGDSAAACCAWLMASLTAVSGVGSSVMRSSMTDTTSFTLTGVSTRAWPSCGSSCPSASSVREFASPEGAPGSDPSARHVPKESVRERVSVTAAEFVDPSPSTPFALSASPCSDFNPPRPSTAVLANLAAVGDSFALNGEFGKDRLVGVGDPSGDAGSGPTKLLLGVHGRFLGSSTMGSGNRTVNDLLNGHRVFSNSSTPSRISLSTAARRASSGSATGSSMRQYCGRRICRTKRLESSSMHQHWLRGRMGWRAEPQLRKATEPGAR